MSRPTAADLDLSALRHNLRAARAAAPNSRVCAVVKANGYGHGDLRVARALAEADAMAVACLEEAHRLREGGITRPILLLEGPFEAAELAECSRLGLDIAVHDPSQVEMLARARLAAPLPVWVKVDTGMHRLGLAPAELPAVLTRLADCLGAAPGPRLMSHLARADDRSDPYTGEQLAVFAGLVPGLAAERSLANSAGVLGWPGTQLDWIRPGIMLYGVSPFVDGVGRDLGLRPVMTLRSRLIAVRALRRGDPVGYGGDWVCPEDMRVGVAAIGYGDGYPRHAPPGTPVLVGGREARLAGRVSMDMLCIDLRGLPEARTGDPVTLWGEGLPVETVARWAGTIPYTPLCAVTARVHMREHHGAVQGQEPL